MLRYQNPRKGTETRILVPPLPMVHLRQRTKIPGAKWAPFLEKRSLYYRGTETSF